MRLSKLGNTRCTPDSAFTRLAASNALRVVSRGRSWTLKRRVWASTTAIHSIITFFGKVKQRNNIVGRPRIYALTKVQVLQLESLSSQNITYWRGSTAVGLCTATRFVQRPRRDRIWADGRALRMFELWIETYVCLYAYLIEQIQQHNNTTSRNVSPFKSSHECILYDTNN